MQNAASGILDMVCCITEQSELDFGIQSHYNSYLSQGRTMWYQQLKHKACANGLSSDNWFTKQLYDIGHCIGSISI